MEEFEIIFNENNLKLDKNDERLDLVEDISSSDEEIYNPEYKRDYQNVISKASFNIDEV